MKIDFKLVYDRAKNNIKMILLMIMLSMISSLLVSYQFAVPMYQASAQVLIGGERAEKEELNKYMIQDEIRFLDTYREIITSPVILSKVEETTNLNLSINELRERLTVEFKDESQVFSISVNHEKYETAVLLTNAVTKIFVEEVEGVMNVNQITLLDLADTQEEAVLVSAEPSMKLGVAILSAFSASLGLAFILPELNSSIQNSQDAEKWLQVKVIGQIPPIEKEGAVREMQIFLKKKQV